jgi:hypothetical protein
MRLSFRGLERLASFVRRLPDYGAPGEIFVPSEI